MAFGTVVCVRCFELSIVIVFVAIRAAFVGNQKSGRKLRPKRRFMTLLAFDEPVLPFKRIIGEGMIERLDRKRCPRSGCMTRFALSDTEFRVVG